MPHNVGRIKITKIESICEAERRASSEARDDNQLLSGLENEREHDQHKSREMTIAELSRTMSTPTPMNTPSMLPTPRSIIRTGFGQSLQLHSGSGTRKGPQVGQVGQVSRKQHDLLRECMQDVGVSMVVGSRSQHDLEMPNLTGHDLLCLSGASGELSETESK